MRARTALKRAGITSGDWSKQRAIPRNAEHHCRRVCSGRSGAAEMTFTASAKLGSYELLVIGKSLLPLEVARDGCR